MSAKAFAASPSVSMNWVATVVRAARAERLGKLIAAAHEDKLGGRIDDAFFQGKRAEWEHQRAEALDEARRLVNVDAKSIDVGIKVFELANLAYDPMIQRTSAEERLVEVLYRTAHSARGMVGAAGCLSNCDP